MESDFVFSTVIQTGTSFKVVISKPKCGAGGACPYPRCTMQTRGSSGTTETRLGTLNPIIRSRREKGTNRLAMADLNQGRSEKPAGGAGGRQPESKRDVGDMSSATAQIEKRKGGIGSSRGGNAGLGGSTAMMSLLPRILPLVMLRQSSRIGSKAMVLFSHMLILRRRLGGEVAYQ